HLDDDNGGARERVHREEVDEMNKNENKSHAKARRREEDSLFLRPFAPSRLRVSLLTACVLIFITPFFLLAAPPVAQLIDEKPLPMQLIGVGKVWQLTWQTADGKQKQSPGESLVAWGEWKEPGRGALVVLSGGGWLVGELRALDRE